jgi:hypothetical protein
MHAIRNTCYIHIRWQLPAGYSAVRLYGVLHACYSLLLSRMPFDANLVVSSYDTSHSSHRCGQAI